MIGKIVSKGLSQFAGCFCVHFVLGKVDYHFDGLVVGVRTRPWRNGTGPKEWKS